MYFTNYLDRSNLANAYVSGMKEELGFAGNQYNQINTVFTVGYVYRRFTGFWMFKPQLGHQVMPSASSLSSLQVLDF